MKTGNLIQTIGWYAAHVVLLAAALVAVGPLHMQLVMVTVATSFTVATIGWLRARHAQRTFPLHYAVALLGAGLSLSVLLLAIDWAVGMGDRTLTARSFVSDLISALTFVNATAAIIILGPSIMLLVSAAAGSYLATARARLRL